VSRGCDTWPDDQTDNNHAKTHKHISQQSALVETRGVLPGFASGAHSLAELEQTAQRDERAAEVFAAGAPTPRDSDLFRGAQRSFHVLASRSGERHAPARQPRVPLEARRMPSDDSSEDGDGAGPPARPHAGVLLGLPEGIGRVRSGDVGGPAHSPAGSSRASSLTGATSTAMAAAAAAASKSASSATAGRGGGGRVRDKVAYFCYELVMALTTEDLARVQDAFDNDEFGADGEVNSDQFARMLPAVLATSPAIQNRSRAEVDALSRAFFDNVDADGNLGVDWEEFSAYLVRAASEAVAAQSGDAGCLRFQRVPRVLRHPTAGMHMGLVSLQLAGRLLLTAGSILPSAAAMAAGHGSPFDARNDIGGGGGSGGFGGGFGDGDGDDAAALFSGAAVSLHRPLRALEGAHGGYKVAAACDSPFPRAARRIITAAGDGSMAEWDNASLSVRVAWRAEAPQLCVAPVGPVLWSGGTDNAITVWDVRKGYVRGEGGSRG
jgi:hypothetical protein